MEGREPAMQKKHCQGSSEERSEGEAGVGTRWCDEQGVAPFIASDSRQSFRPENKIILF